MKISQSTATNIAKQLTAKHIEKVNKLRKEFIAVVTIAYKKQIPKEVIDFSEKYPEYTQWTADVVLNSHGFRWQYVSLGLKSPKGQNTHMSLTTQLAKKLQTLDGKIAKADKEYKQLLTEVQYALLALGTTTRINEKFPEAAKLIPQKTNTALSVDLKKIRSAIQL